MNKYDQMLEAITEIEADKNPGIRAAGNKMRTLLETGKLASIYTYTKGVLDGLSALSDDTWPALDKLEALL